VAQIVGITERAVQKIVRDLQDGGLVSVTKHGRRNRYRLRLNQPLRHTLEAHCTIGELLEMVNRHAPGLEPVEEASEPVPAPIVLAPVKATKPEPTPANAPMAGGATDDSAVPEPSATAAPGDEEAAASSPEKPPPAPRRRKTDPADDGEQGSLF
jgi:hypothetical protein